MSIESYRMEPNVSKEEVLKILSSVRFSLEEWQALLVLAGIRGRSSQTVDEYAKHLRKSKAQFWAPGHVLLWDLIVVFGSIVAAFLPLAVAVLAPETFMNDSGRSVGACVRDLRLGVEDVIVVYDDIELDPGRVRARARALQVRRAPGGEHYSLGAFETIDLAAVDVVLEGIDILPLEPGTVHQLGFLIADRTAGPFRLEIAFIATYSQDSFSQDSFSHDSFSQD